MNPMVQFTLRAARGAVEHFLRVRERIENAHEEFNLDRLLEDTARKAEATIIQQLQRGYPLHGFSGRYTPYKAGEGEGEDTVWKIEPLHGYSNLAVAGKGFALSVVCLVKGRPEHAVVISPFGDDEYIASRGRGATISLAIFPGSLNVIGLITFVQADGVAQSLKALEQLQATVNGNFALWGLI